MRDFQFQSFRSVATGKAVTVSDVHPFLRQADIDIDVKQHWLEEPAGETRADGVLIINRALSHAIDVVGAVFEDQSALQHYPINRGANQLWLQLDWAQDPTNKLVACATHPEFVWDIPFGDSSRHLQIFRRHGEDNQRWTVEQLMPIQAFKITSAATGKPLDVPGSDQDEGTAIQQFRDNGGLSFNQFWQILKGDGTFAPVDNFTSVQPVNIMCVCNQKLLQVPLRMTLDAPTNVTQGAINETENQVWYLVPDDDAVIFQASYNRDFVMDLPSGSSDDNVIIQVYPHNAGQNQRWRIM